MPQTPSWGGATAPLPRLHPLGAPALRASLGAFGPSIVSSEREILHPPLGAPTLSKSWLRPCWSLSIFMHYMKWYVKKSLDCQTVARSSRRCAFLNSCRLVGVDLRFKERPKEGGKE